MADDALATADVWTVLDQLQGQDAVDQVAHAADRIREEWGDADNHEGTADALAALVPLLDRLKVLVEARRKARLVGGDLAFNELADALSAWLDTKGWTVLVVGNPEVRGFHTYEFAVKFTGGRRPEGRKLPDIILPGRRRAALTEKPGTCRWCGCHEDRACPQMCGWANAKQTLCTACVNVDREWKQQPTRRENMRRAFFRGYLVGSADERAIDGNINPFRQGAAQRGSWERGRVAGAKEAA